MSEKDMLGKVRKMMWLLYQDCKAGVAVVCSWQEISCEISVYVYR